MDIFLKQRKGINIFFFTFGLSLGKMGVILDMPLSTIDCKLGKKLKTALFFDLFTKILEKRSRLKPTTWLTWFLSKLGSQKTSNLKIRLTEFFELPGKIQYKIFFDKTLFKKLSDLNLN